MWVLEIDLRLADSMVSTFICWAVSLSHNPSIFWFSLSFCMVSFWHWLCQVEFLFGWLQCSRRQWLCLWVEETPPTPKGGITHYLPSNQASAGLPFSAVPYSVLGKIHCFSQCHQTLFSVPQALAAYKLPLRDWRMAFHFCVRVTC